MIGHLLDEHDATPPDHPCTCTHRWSAHQHDDNAQGCGVCPCPQFVPDPDPPWIGA